MEAGRPGRAGLAIVPEARRVFPEMTVRENLEMGAFTRRTGGVGEDLERVLALSRGCGAPAAGRGHPVGRRAADAGHGPALMARPRVIIMDEPSMGLAPLMVEGVFELIIG